MFRFVGVRAVVVAAVEDVDGAVDGSIAGTVDGTVDEAAVSEVIVSTLSLRIHEYLLVMSLPYITTNTLQSSVLLSLSS